MFVRLAWFRFFLAASVVLFHLWRDAAPQAGRIAVMLFFFISGYLVTWLIKEVYAGRPRDFLVNRFLRIFPVYWACLAIAAVIILVLNGAAGTFHKPLFFDDQPDSIFANLFVFTLNGQSSRWLPPAWSLNIELVWYIILFVAFFLARAEQRVLFWVFLALPVIYGFADQAFYGSWTAMGYAFVLGAMRYDWNHRFSVSWEYLSLGLLVCCLFVFPLVFGLKGGNPGNTFSWLNLLLPPYLLFLCFPWFVETTGQNRSAELAGALSYPLFLIHWPIAAVFGTIGFERNSPEIFAASLLASLAVSYLVVLLVERPVAKVRRAIRAKA